VEAIICHQTRFLRTPKAFVAKRVRLNFVGAHTGGSMYFLGFDSRIESRLVSGGDTTKFKALAKPARHPYGGSWGCRADDKVDENQSSSDIA